jgi:predicted Holliday junction resolvase-like endonuclease
MKFMRYKTLVLYVVIFVLIVVILAQKSEISKLKGDLVGRETTICWDFKEQNRLKQDNEAKQKNIRDLESLCFRKDCELKIANERAEQAFDVAYRHRR